jgi:hypothetical protein
MVISETDGVLGEGASIEAVRDAMPKVLSAAEFFHPRVLAERSARIGALLGFRG